MSFALSLCGWIVAAILVGYVLGRRGAPVAAPASAAATPRRVPRAKLFDAAGRKVPPGGGAADPVLMPEEREQMINDFANEVGCSRQQAELEVDRIAAELAHAGLGGGIA